MCVVGAGTMGRGIAQVLAQSGVVVTLTDQRQEALDAAMASIEASLQRAVSRGRISEEDAALAVSLIDTEVGADAARSSDLVIEAIVEDLDAKRAVFQELDRIAPGHAILASNTSSISITALAAATGRPDQVVGMHFCLPAQLMKLIEMSPGLLTSDETFKTAWDWTEICGQIPVKTQDKPGFILNALLVPFNNDAIRAVEAGVASPADIDKAIKSALGYKMGPLELIDLVGLDTQVRLCEAFYPITLDARAAAPPLLRRMVAAGLLGRKTGRGFFTYDGAKMFGA